MGILSVFKKSEMTQESPWDEQRVLIKWNGPRGTKLWTIADSFEGVQVYGDTGSGKTSTSAKILATSMLRAGYGGLVLTVKPEDTEDWKKLLEQTGRSKDGIIFDHQSDYCFNFLEEELHRGQQNNVGTLNAAQILAELVSLAQRTAGRTDDFWNQASNEMVAHALEVISASGEVPSLRLAKELIESAPRSLDDLKEDQWRKDSRLWELLQKALSTAADQPDFLLAHNYWTEQFPRLAEKTRSSVMVTFTASVARYFCPEIIHRLFGRKTTNVKPEDISGGKVIIVNLPIKQFGAVGRFAGVLWKYCAQLEFERRKDKKRPVFIFSDESHHFLSDYDQLFQTTARSSRCSVVYLTQNLSNYYSLSPGHAGKHRVDSLTSCLKTKIMHQCSHSETRIAFSDAIGKFKDISTSENTQRQGWGPLTSGETHTPQDSYRADPDRATLLLTGGKANKYRVTAIVSKAGKLVDSGTNPYLFIAEFDQLDLDSGSGGNSAVAILKP